MARIHENGRGAVGCLLTLVVIAALVIIGAKAVPARINVGELQDYCVRQAESASLPDYSDEDIAKRILAKAQELKLPVNANDIQVSRRAGEVHVLVRYTLPLDFLFYTYNWHVEHKLSRILF